MISELLLLNKKTYTYFDSTDRNETTRNTRSQDE